MIKEFFVFVLWLDQLVIFVDRYGCQPPPLLTKDGAVFLEKRRRDGTGGFKSVLTPHL